VGKTEWKCLDQTLRGLWRICVLCKWIGEIGSRSPFHKHFKCSFCVRRSQKSKKTQMTWLSFVLLGSALVKAAHKWTPGVDFASILQVALWHKIVYRRFHVLSVCVCIIIFLKLLLKCWWNRHQVGDQILSSFEPKIWLVVYSQINYRPTKEKMRSSDDVIAFSFFLNQNNCYFISCMLHNNVKFKVCLYLSQSYLYGWYNMVCPTM